MGFSDGLYEYDFEGQGKEILMRDGQHITAQRLATDSQGRLFAATFYQGLMVIENGETTHELGNGKVFNGQTVKKVMVLRDTVWLATSEAIGYLSSDCERFTNLLEGNLGMLHFQDFWPTRHALLVLLEKHLLKVPRQAEEEVSDLHINLHPLAITGGQIEAVLEAVNFKNPNHTRLFYRLGKETKWESIDDLEATLRYSGLPPGDYELQYFAQDLITGAKSSEGFLGFHIPYLWWQKPWFKLLAASLCMLAVYGAILAWSQQYKLKQQEREQLWMSQLKAIKAQMNPHFLYNALNTVQGLVYSNQTNQAAHLLGLFSLLMRKSLEGSEIPYLALRDEIELLQVYLKLEVARFIGQDFQYAIRTEQVQDLLDFQIPSMLIQPFVENAIKHGLLHQSGKKRLDILFEPAQEGIVVSITDNGIGREKAEEIQQRRAKKLNHFTMNTTAQRIELLNKMGMFAVKLSVLDLYDEGQSPMGTRVLIHILPQKKRISIFHFFYLPKP